MGRSYYYFIASLPMAQWNGKCPISVEEFLSASQRLLHADDYILLEKLLKNQEDDVVTDNAAARSWIRFNRSFRNEIAFFRAQRLHKDPQKAVRGIKENEPTLRDVVQEASKMPDLLEAEKLIDKTSWQFLEELVSGHYFDLEFLIGYGLKLKILERHQEYLSPQGGIVFDGIQAAELPIDWAVPGI